MTFNHTLNMCVVQNKQLELAWLMFLTEEKPITAKVSYNVRHEIKVIKWDCKNLILHDKFHDCCCTESRRIASERQSRILTLWYISRFWPLAHILISLGSFPRLTSLNLPMTAGLLGNSIRFMRRRARWYCTLGGCLGEASSLSAFSLK